MSAILPQRKPPRTPLKLSLAGAGNGSSTPSTPSSGPSTSNSSSTTTTVDTTASSTSPRPNLSVSSVSKSLGALSLAIPLQGPSHYASALNDPDDSESDSPESTRNWSKEVQDRMTGQLLDVIHGPTIAAPFGLEDELSGATRRDYNNAYLNPGSSGPSGTSGARPRSGSRIGIRPSTSGSMSSEASEAGDLTSSTVHGGGSTTGVVPLLVPTDRSSSSAIGDDEDLIELEVTPETLQDLGRLGEGASGEVRKVLHKPTGIVMAKKTIQTSPDPKVHKQHLRELLFMRDCQNPFIVQYYGAFLDDHNTSIGICMEFCEGGSLDTLYRRVEKRGWRTGEKVLGKVAESVLAGLVYLHDRKIIHRGASRGPYLVTSMLIDRKIEGIPDIKPSNILVTREGQVKLCDFGVSGELVNSFAGTFVGTTFYLSPERIRGEQYTITSDVWSMAVSVLEVALNRFPFPAAGEAPLKGPIELVTYLVRMDGPIVVDEPEEGIVYTKAFKNFVQLCLDKNPTTRPGPLRLLSHPWIRRSVERQPPADLASWVRTLDE